MSAVEVFRNDTGAVTAQALELPWLPGSRFWALEPVTDLGPSACDELLSAAYAELERRDEDVPGRARGACLLIGDPAERARRPELRWADPPLTHAGYLSDGRQVRIAYTGPDRVALPPPERRGGVWHPGPGYRIEAVPGRVAPEAVIELWVAEGALSRSRAEQRAQELLLVATDDARRPVGAATAYLDFNVQLRGLFWAFRVFVAASHRLSNVAFALALESRDRLAARFAAGDQRGLGVVWELENRGLRDRWPIGWWATPDVVLVGRTDRFDLRVHPFAGALTPPP